MAFEKRIWTDRQSEFPTRRKLSDAETGQLLYTVDVERDEGLVTDDGIPYNAATMNDLENRIDSAITGSVPKGCILMWSGSVATIPEGWALCNGSNGTPNLLNRFIVGAGSSYSVGATGGADTVTLTTTQMPSHNHTFSSGSAASNGAHAHDPGSGVGFANSSMSSAPVASGSYTNAITGFGSFYSTASGGAHTHSVTGTIGYSGSGSSHENRPPYYALCYIMKL